MFIALLRVALAGSASFVLAPALLAHAPAAAVQPAPDRDQVHGPAANVKLAQAAPAAAVYKVGPLVIESPWSRATPGGAKVGAGYMRITNTGTVPDRLVGGTAPVAARFELHEMSMQGDVMRMRLLENGLEIAPGRTVELKPGGYHAMLVDLKQPLRQGESFKGTLVFEKAGTVAVEFAVHPIGAAGGPAGHQHRH